MKKQTLISIFLITIIASSIQFVFLTNASTPAVVSLNPAIISDKNVGDNFTVAVHIEGVNNLWQWTFGVTWDPTVLNMTKKPTEGTFLSSVDTTLFIYSPVDYTKGSIKECISTIMSNLTASGSGDLATLSFKVIGSGSSAIGLFNCSLQGPNTGTGNEGIHADIPFSIANATINITAPSSSPFSNLTPSTTANPTPTPVASETTSTSPNPPVSASVTPSASDSSSSASPSPSITAAITQSASTQGSADVPFGTYLIAGAGIAISIVLIAAVFLRRTRNT
jgi:hypothetical protein